ncbi:MAG: alginate export family protein [Candidatus Omnitrophica bacterium]|nr:alginate export family protein [Candidatus Omnitrophota bacterium]
MKRIIGILLTVCFVLPVVAWAQAAAPSAGAGSSDEVQFKWGGALRLRNEYWRNWKDMDNEGLDNRNFFRIKSTLWGQADYGTDLTGYMRLANEFRVHTYFGGTSGSYPDKTSSKKGYHGDLNDILVDNLYADVRNVVGLPVDLRLGRQDFLGAYGEGFLIMDGTPGDGSRTFYFNAAKAAWRIDEENVLDVIGIQGTRDEEYLPIINRVEMERRTTPTLDKAQNSLNTTDEEALILYWKNKGIENLNLEGYYIYKHEDDEGGAGAQAQDSDLNTVGGFAKYVMAPCTLRGQLATQFGDYGTVDREGLGGYLWVDHDFKDVQWSPVASLGYVYLSGDDPATSDNESWNPLFSRWPNWSELYCLSYGAETGISAYWTNLSMFGAALKLKPTEKMKLSFWFYLLRANENVAASTIFSGTSKNRGYMPQARIDYAFSKNVSAYFLAEYFVPKKFYVEKDPALFLRTEISIKF